MIFCVVQPFWVERHLDVVLEVLQMVRSKFLLYETCRYLPEEDSLKIRMIALLMTEIFNFTTIEGKNEL